MNPEKPTKSSLTSYVLPIIAGVVAFFIGIACLVGIGFAGWITLQRPNQDSAQVSQTDPENLVLSSATLSEQWEISNVETDGASDNSSLADDVAMVEVEHFNNLPAMQNLRSSGTQTIYRYLSLSDTHRDYRQRAEGWFQSENYTEWVTPPAVTAPSTVADEYRFGCAIEIKSDRLICVIVARYGQYLSEFQIYLGNSNLSDAEIQNILTAIDQRFIEMGVKE